MEQITIGHDSEFALLKAGKIVSALDAISPFENQAGRYFPDNMNCEIAINPVNNLKDFNLYTDILLDHIKEQGFELLMEPVIKYPDEALQNPLAYISGCNPDYSGYSREQNQAPDFTTSDSTRSAGAHIHVGVEGLDPYNWSRWMDAFVGLPMLLHEKKNDRRKMYGGAGCLRVKPYGGEYRTLSNVWLDSEEKRAFVWENTIKAVEMSLKRDSREAIQDWIDIPMAIDEHNTDLASSTIDRLYIFGVSKL